MPADPPVKLSLKSRAWRVAKRLLRSLVLIYLLVGAGMYLFQTKLIFPGAAYQNTPDAQITPRADEELLHLKTPAGTPIAALFCHAYPVPTTNSQNSALITQHPSPRPTILFFYGNAMCVTDAAFIADRFRKLGYPVLLTDYEGFGMSGGSPSEQGCYNAAEAAYQYLLTRPDVDPHQFIAAGWSLGAAVAIDLAHRHRAENSFCALMTFSAFSSMVDVAHFHYPFLPVSLVLKHRFMSIDKIKDLTLPYFASHGTHDAIIPFALTQQLIKAYGGAPNHLTFLPCNTDHNDFFDEGGEPLQNAMAAFLQSVIH